MLFEVVDEAVDLFLRLRPVELSALVLDVAVQGREREVDELTQPMPPVAIARK